MTIDPSSDRLDSALNSLRRHGDVHARLAALRAIVEYWHGPILPNDGMQVSELAELSLPMPLDWWYRWAGRRYKIMSGQNFLYIPHDDAHPYWQLVIKDGFLHFHTENQGVYNWRTLPGGEDPPVFGRYSHEDDWTREAVTLAEHLVLNAILEAVVCHAKYRACSASLSEFGLKTIAARAPPLAIGPWRWCETRFYAGAGVFMTASPVGKIEGRNLFSVWIGAKREGKLDFIEPLIDDDWEVADL